MHTMPATPEVQPLPYRSRRRVFFLLLFIFLVAVPVFAFYAAGYRYDFWGATPGITTTGGMYVIAEAEGSEIYLNESEVRNLRVFRDAAYIQGLTPGAHRLHVQAPGLHTWVKELPVHEHIVTEANAFNLPVTPQIRPVTAYLTAQGEAVYLKTATTSLPFSFASSSVSLYATTSAATTTFIANPEFDFVESLFASSSVARGVVTQLIEGVNSAFGFASQQGTTTKATTTVSRDSVTLYERSGEVYARYEGARGDIPYYFCIPFGANASSSKLYGEHFVALVTDAIDVEEQSVTELDESERLCRDEIRIDRKGQEVVWFEFFPGSADLVLMQLGDGLYVVEIDDRAWQNSQLLYPGEDLTITLNGSQIFVQDDGRYLEVLTELIAQQP